MMPRANHQKGVSFLESLLLKFAIIFLSFCCNVAFSNPNSYRNLAVAMNHRQLFRRGTTFCYLFVHRKDPSLSPRLPFPGLSMQQHSSDNDRAVIGTSTDCYISQKVVPSATARADCASIDEECVEVDSLLGTKFSGPLGKEGEYSNASSDDKSNADYSDGKLDLVVNSLKKKRRRLEIEITATDLAIKRADEKRNELAVNSLGETRSLTRGSYDYGFTSKSSGSALSGNGTFGDGSVPPSAVILAIDNFKREFAALVESIKGPAGSKAAATQANEEALRKLASLTLSNEAIWERENARPPIRAPWVIKGPYLILCLLLDKLFDGAPIDRFYFLETVARMPYFSYITMV